MSKSGLNARKTDNILPDIYVKISNIGMNMTYIGGEC
jgi:hypothetical protein